MGDGYFVGVPVDFVGDRHCHGDWPWAHQHDHGREHRPGADFYPAESGDGAVVAGAALCGGGTGTGGWLGPDFAPPYFAGDGVALGGAGDVGDRDGHLGSGRLRLFGFRGATSNARTGDDAGGCVYEWVCAHGPLDDSGAGAGDYDAGAGV